MDLFHENQEPTTKIDGDNGSKATTIASESTKGIKYRSVGF